MVASDVSDSHMSCAMAFLDRAAIMQQNHLCLPCRVFGSSGLRTTPHIVDMISALPLVREEMEGVRKAYHTVVSRIGRKNSRTRRAWGDTDVGGNDLISANKLSLDTKSGLFSPMPLWRIEVYSRTCDN